MTSIFRFTALLLIALLVRLPSVAQDASGLQIRALSESIDQNTLAVIVTDAQGAVPDAAVTFRLPEDGPGTFADGRRLAVVKTDHSGQARVSGIRWTEAGAASVRITATKGTEHAGILIDHQANVATATKTAGQAAETSKVAVRVASVPAAQDISAASKLAVLAQPATPAQPRPAPSVAIATKSFDQKGALSTAAPQKSVGQPGVPVISQNAAAAVQTQPQTMPAIEPPHVSINSVSRTNSAQTSSVSRTGDAEPDVSITGAGQRSHGGSKKWIILAAIAAGAGAGAAVMLSRGKSSTAATNASTAGVSIGTPTISIGAP